MGGASGKESDALRRFGRYFGMAFQIVDDCLDFTGNEFEFGKTLGADCATGVMTLPLIRLMTISDESKKGQIAKKLISQPNAEKLKNILVLIHEFGTIDYSLKIAHDLSRKALAELDIFRDSPAKESLCKLLEYVLERKR